MPITASLGALSYSRLTSAEPAVYWIATLENLSGGANTSGIAIGNQARRDGSGNVYITGSLEDELFIAKYNSAGTIQWQRSLSNNYTSASGLTVDDSGNVYIVGSANDTGTLFVVVAKYNSEGTIQWQRSLSGTFSAVGQGIYIDNSGNVYITGYTNLVTNNNDLLIAKYNSAGTIQWQRALGSPAAPPSLNNETGFSVTTDSLGNVYVTGTSNILSGSLFVIVAKYNSSGTLQWQNRIISSVSTGYGIAADELGNVYVAGYTTSTSGGGTGSIDMLIIKYDTNGTIQWMRSLGVGTNTFFPLEGRGIALDGRGNVYVAGQARTASSQNSILIVKYNTSGALQWQRTLGLSGSPITSLVGQGISIDNSGDVCVTGTTSAFSASGRSVIAKVPADGSLTGVYSNFIYAVSTFTDRIRTLTSATSLFTDQATTLTSATTTFISATTTLTSNTIII
jgi:uncharacterized delta-60 repeat protein